MLLWLKANIGSLVIGLVLAAVVFVVARKLVRDWRAGKTSCGCGCEGCAMHGACHKRT